MAEEVRAMMDVMRWPMSRKTVEMHSSVILVLLMFVGACCASRRFSSSRSCERFNWSIKNMEEKVNDLWGQLLFPVNPTSGALHAVCNMRPNPSFPTPPISGSINFRQLSPSKDLEMEMDIRGFPRNTGSHGHGIHVHAYADLKDGCEGAGPHFNPGNVSHPHHPGDFGNFDHDATGRLFERMKCLPSGTLFGPESFIGRSIVIHEGEDDLGTGGNPGSLLHGNSGRRLACCVIGISAAPST
uniref:extracellular superoxide dismutase [Cu-Zn] isoform X2 n=1 Tax=Myxine glutinosa TaxID=7769 RepID=UPI00358E9DDD